EAAFILDKARALTASVFQSLAGHEFVSFRTLTITVRFSNFTTLNRSHTPKQPITTEDQMWIEVARLLLPFLDRRQIPRLLPIRLIGVRAEKLTAGSPSPASTPALFDQPPL